MLLYIVRHAWAGDRDAAKYPNDDLRPLTDKGRKRFRKFIRRLAKRGFAPAYVATSPLVRCQQTADLVVEALRGVPTLEEVEALAPGSRIDDLIQWTNQYEEDVAWVGHAPDVGSLCGRLIGGGSIDFAKGAVAAISFDDRRPAIGQGTLLWLVTAEQLKC